MSNLVFIYTSKFSVVDIKKGQRRLPLDIMGDCLAQRYRKVGLAQYSYDEPRYSLACYRSYVVLTLGRKFRFVQNSLVAPHHLQESSERRKF
jgi:hypothetical protein